MNPIKVRTWEEVEAWLQRKGFVPTGQVTPDGGRFWRSKSKKHIVVKDHLDGYYPEYLWSDLYDRAMQIVP